MAALLIVGLRRAGRRHRFVTFGLDPHPGAAAAVRTDDDAPMRIDDRTLDLSAEEGARVVALGLLDEATDAAGALAAGSGEEPLHDFRVAVRRLRSALRTYRPWLEAGVRRRHERRLKKIARSTNAARDAEVQLAWLAAREEELTATQRAGHAAAMARFEARVHGGPDAARVAARHEKAARKLRRRLERYERTVQTGEDEGASFGAVLASLVTEHAAALAAAMGAIRGPADQEDAHAARIEGKRLRYLLEPLRGLRGADATDAIAELKRLQDLLGELHDAHVLSGELGAALGEVAADRARQATAAALASVEEARALRARLRPSPRAGLLALVRLVRDRRDALFAALDRDWRPAGLDALVAQARALSAALEARAGGRLEHERKYLLSAVPPRAGEEPAVEIVQGWLPGSRLRERVRRVLRDGTERYFRAVKRGAGAVRVEAEEETTREVFETLWPLTEGRRVAKRRHRVRDGARLWEIDTFTDRELVIAEVELPAHVAEVAVPEWLGPFVLREVTGDPAYLNENLAVATPAPAPVPAPA
jgi:CHAD domain-containing protein/CYTH domain-containing protein